MADIDNFSTVRFLARHEIGKEEIEIMLKWQKSLETICKNSNRAGTTMIHFKVQQRRVNKFIKNLPI